MHRSSNAKQPIFERFEIQIMYILFEVFNFVMSVKVDMKKFLDKLP